MDVDLPKPTIILEDAVSRAIAASGCRSEELVGISAVLCQPEDGYPLRWEIGVEPASMRFMDPHFIRVRIDAATGAAHIIETR